MLGVSACSSGEALSFEDANNYAFSNQIAMQVTEVRSGADLTIDWSGLTTDIRERSVSPEDIEQISLAKFNYPFDQLLPLLAANEIDAQSESDEVYLFDNPGVTAAMTTLFEVAAIPFIPANLLVEEANTTWTVSAVNYPRGQLDLLMSRAFVPLDAATNTELSLQDGDTTLDWSVDLHSQAQIDAEAGAKSYALDWSGLTKDVYGHPFDPIAADQLLIGHYGGDVASVEAEFLQLDTVADEIYWLSSLGVTEIDDLSRAATDAGKPFDGFTTDGTWLVGFLCTSCSTPVPLALAVVSVK